MTDKKQQKLKSELIDKAFENTNSASVNDCTGITPTVPKTPYEAQSYTDTVDVPVTPEDEEMKDTAQYYKKYTVARKRFLKRL